MKKILLTFTMLVILSGCTNIAVMHQKYCDEFSPMERGAFRILAGGNFKIECD